MSGRHVTAETAGRPHITGTDVTETRQLTALQVEALAFLDVTARPVAGDRLRLTLDEWDLVDRLATVLGGLTALAGTPRTGQPS